MAKLTIMRGLPASGKTTRAEELMRASGNAVRINKDLLRTMLHFDKFSGHNESLTREAARVLAKTFLVMDKNVIVDDTNLNSSTLQGWKDLAKELGVIHEVIDMETPVEVCVLRDAAREKAVGGTVIKNMAMKAGLKVFPYDNIVLCDIDGTIADTEHRLHYVNGATRDWKGFFSEMDKDPVRKDVQEILVDLYNKGYTIIFISARPETYKDVTLLWLHQNNLTFAYTLIMRRENDKRPDTEVKKDMLDQYFKDRGLIHKVIDDRPSVIRMWRALGLEVLDVGKGVDF